MNVRLCVKLKKVSFFNGTHMHFYCIFALFRGITIFKRKMASLPESGTDPPFHEETDLTTTIEKTKDHFVKWLHEKDDKWVVKQIILSPNYKITLGELGHGTVWNIYNLRCEQNAKFPNTAPSTEMIVNAKVWMEAFRSYTLRTMKVYAMNEYVRIFNQPRWKKLKGSERSIISFNEIIEKMKDSDDEEV